MQFEAPDDGDFDALRELHLTLDVDILTGLFDIAKAKLMMELLDVKFGNNFFS